MLNENLCKLGTETAFTVPLQNVSTTISFSMISDGLGWFLDGFRGFELFLNGLLFHSSRCVAVVSLSSEARTSPPATSAKIFAFSEVFGGPGGFRKVREAGRNNFLLFSPASDFMVPSYGEKATKVNVLQGLIGAKTPGFLLI